MEAFQKLGINDFDTFFSKVQQNQLFDLYEKGKITSNDLRTELKKHSQPGTSDDAINTSWNAILLDLPPKRLDMLKKINHSHRSFLLSNTNEIHITQIQHYLQQTFGIPNLESHFEKVYLSYKINMRKPDVEIFQFVLTENNLIPEETLFIDDSPQHLEGAKKLGIHTYWLDVERESITDLFLTT